jgi:formylglycine-generating enzyme required for sulfatase activity
MRWRITWAWMSLFLVGCGPISQSSTESPNLTGLAPSIHLRAGLELRLIAPGRFLMGADDGPQNERPLHEVLLTQPFYLGTTEVTHAQFAAFVSETGYLTTAEQGQGAKVWRDGQWVMDPQANHTNVFPGPNRPVVAVTHTDAVAFCSWLTIKERAAKSIGAAAEIRLPTEAEWEYAARAGTDKNWSGAENAEELCLYANVPDKSAERAGLGREVIACDDNVGLETADVARYQPNAFGIYDMTGNVWEWTNDRMGSYPRESVTNPRGAKQGTDWVVRGGSWSGNLHGLRVTHRDGYPADLRGGAIGFRIALALDASK